MLIYKPMPLLNFLLSGGATTTPTMFTRDQIQAQSSKIRLSDSDPATGLDLYCYNRCDNSELPLIKRCRGVVFNGNDLIVQGFPYTDEFTGSDNDSIEAFSNALKKPLDSYKFFDAHEGALLRVFYWNDKWYISTHRKLDAFRSKWSSKESFGTMFQKALESLYKNKDEDFMKQLGLADETSDSVNVYETFLDSLDKTKQYMFLVLNNYDNRIVCIAPDEPTVYHVGTFTTPSTCTCDEFVGITHPKEYKFRDIGEIVKHVEENGCETVQGVIVFDTEENRQYKLFNTEYSRYFQTRGNEPSVKFRYLQVRMNKKQVDDLYYLYPKYADAFDDYENTLYECAKQINTNYINRFIKKKYVTVPKEEYSVMKKCHDWHLEDRTKNRISLRKVIDILNEQNPSSMNRIIRRYKNDETKEQITKQAKTTRLRARSYSHNSEEPTSHV